MVSIYTAPEVAKVIALNPALMGSEFRTLSIADQIQQQAQVILQAHHAGDERIAMHVRSWWPNARGQSLGDILHGPFSETDALLTMSREYGFASWEDVQRLKDLAPDPTFETALDCVMSGNLDGLSAYLKNTPSLIRERSRYGHGATLLHYVGANGVESHRQVTPSNIVAVAKLLISHGAQRDATAQIYGGGQTPYDLASTSAHPHNAGVADQLNQVLKLP